MRILAVDPGTKRVGLALSDPSGTIASALATVEAEPSSTLAARLAAIAKEHEVERVIVGLPRRLDGSRGPEAASAERLAAEIRAAVQLPVETVDERLTTAAAERSLIEGGVSREKRRQAIDRVAATILLQSHLDRIQANKRRAC
jgi:putative Holliday junction resolvase